MENKKIKWDKVWKSFQRWYDRGHNKLNIWYDWDNQQTKKIEELVEKQLKTKPYLFENRKKKR